MEEIHTTIVQDESNISIWTGDIACSKETSDSISENIAKRTNVCKNVGCGCVDRDCILDYGKD